MGNLRSWQKGQSGNPAGRPRGSKNWSTVVQELLADEQLAEKLQHEKPTWWESLSNKNFASAITVAMILKAAGGDIRAAEWLRRTGYPDNTNYPYAEDDGFFSTNEMQITIVNSRDEIEALNKAEASLRAAQDEAKANGLGAGPEPPA